MTYFDMRPMTRRSKAAYSDTVLEVLYVALRKKITEANRLKDWSFESRVLDAAESATDVADATDDPVKAAVRYVLRSGYDFRGDELESVRREVAARFPGVAARYAAGTETGETI